MDDGSVFFALRADANSQRLAGAPERHAVMPATLCDGVVGGLAVGDGDAVEQGSVLTTITAPDA